MSGCPDRSPVGCKAPLAPGRRAVGMLRGPIGFALPTFAEIFGPDPDELLIEAGEIFGAATRNERDPYGPTGTRDRRGGYLEYSHANRADFTRYFNPLMPTPRIPRDLMVLSTDFPPRTGRYREYRILPPRSLWPNMAKTLELIREVRARTGASINIESVYRSFFVNRKAGGASGSKHLDFSALDLTVAAADLPRVRAYLEHYWWEKGDAIKLGLNFYPTGRFHIDTHTRRGRTRGWDTDSVGNPSRSRARRNYEALFTDPV
jgi:hypothetical protein